MMSYYLFFYLINFAQAENAFSTYSDEMNKYYQSSKNVGDNKKALKKLDQEHLKKLDEKVSEIYTKKIKEEKKEGMRSYRKFMKDNEDTEESSDESIAENNSSEKTEKISNNKSQNTTGTMPESSENPVSVIDFGQTKKK